MQRAPPPVLLEDPLPDRGVAPVEAEDPQVPPPLARCVNDKRPSPRTFTSDALALADCVVVDVQCDSSSRSWGNSCSGQADIAALEDSHPGHRRADPPHILVLIGPRPPLQATEYVAYPFLKKAFERRGIDAEPLRAHDYARIARPGIRGLHPGLLAGLAPSTTPPAPSSPDTSTEVLTSAIPPQPSWTPHRERNLQDLDNSYRATIWPPDEWEPLAERNGVDS